mmetsp:Transcript_3673/g.6451  ORF Transcript_3673/g.6451 Transcript_3673/m.6451 type:complete len:428 (-) Transcript_3673:154-1437(-)
MASTSSKSFALLAAVLAVFLGCRLVSTKVWPVSFILPGLPAFPSDGIEGINGMIEKIGEFDLVGPESLITSKHEGSEFMFAALGDGRVVRLAENPKRGGMIQWETVVRTGVEPSGPEAPKCGSGGPTDTTDTERICGRPLGLLVVKRHTVDPDFAGSSDEDSLVVADACKGLLLVTGIYGNAAKLHVMATRAQSDKGDYSFHLLNAVVQAPDGSLYFTETSQQFSRRRIFHAVFDGHATGRLLRYQASSGNVEVVADKIYMPNGITLSHDKKSLLIVAGVQILRYSLEKQSLQSEPFVDVMVGTGDNIRTKSQLPSGEARDCYWAGLGSKFAQPFSLLKAVSEKPWLRAVLVALVPYRNIVELIPKMTAFAVFDTNGDLVEIYQDSEKSAPWLSEAEVMGDHIYLASWYNPFLARLKKQNLVVSAVK